MLAVLNDRDREIAGTDASIDYDQHLVVNYLTTGFACSPFGPCSCTSRKDGLEGMGHQLVC